MEKIQLSHTVPVEFRHILGIITFNYLSWIIKLHSFLSVFLAHIFPKLFIIIIVISVTQSYALRLIFKKSGLFRLIGNSHWIFMRRFWKQQRHYPYIVTCLAWMVVQHFALCGICWTQSRIAKHWSLNLKAWFLTGILNSLTCSNRILRFSWFEGRRKSYHILTFWLLAGEDNDWFNRGYWLAVIRANCRESKT